MGQIIRWKEDGDLDGTKFACDPTQGDIRRFLVGPSGCEVTGITATPDLRSLFINIQHPGEPANERSSPEQPLAISRWPDGAGRPRSSTVVITRNDGGVIGSRFSLRARIRRIPRPGSRDWPLQA
ncbi:alkaline phosphatase PhoX [Variovorax sp. OV329]|uniref:alkaline phosphatase PhoX n=1 Tax=Variovorax sp. OV329 TaxID=1882825 RepID=UPI0008EBEACA|nr:alkaline phosphatase PhoX [Variovorax sp. OV329]SFL86682.1 protein of unknown function [Variovorax sp. OV329]